MVEGEVKGFAILCPPASASSLKKKLENKGLYDSSRRIFKADLNGLLAVPLRYVSRPFHVEVDGTVFDSSSVVELFLPKSKSAQVISPFEQLQQAVVRLASSLDLATEKVAIPSKWQRHGDLVLLPHAAFTEPFWEGHQEALWQTVASALQVRRLARHGPIHADGKRTPSTDLLLGADPWVTHTDNGITYYFNVQHSMFSQGNITEKLRMAGLSCSGERVVDLYAGIGYFTLPLLVHAQAAHVDACDWNPAAIEALQHSLKANGVAKLCTVRYGDNAEVAPRDVAHRVLLGLIPCSGLGWPVACAALRPDTGGWLHVHGNVCSRPRTQTADACERAVCTQCHCTLCTGVPAMVEAAQLHQTAAASCSGTATSTNLLPGSCTSTNDHASVSSRTTWTQWADEVRNRFAVLLQELRGIEWTVEVAHVEHVKSYAPHIDHIVVDLQCRPV